jgi:cellulose synthase/poly-beta-1,6-N-acetylglucosamine synthase-like glycosyltransferase
MCAEDSEKSQLTPVPRSEASPTIGVSPKVKYCVITPVRDEEQYVLGTIDSVLNQSIRPVEWIIVDDGSTDATSVIIDR